MKSTQVISLGVMLLSILSATVSGVVIPAHEEEAATPTVDEGTIPMPNMPGMPGNNMTLPGNITMPTPTPLQLSAEDQYNYCQKEVEWKYQKCWHSGYTRQYCGQTADNHAQKCHDRYWGQNGMSNSTGNDNFDNN